MYKMNSVQFNNRVKLIDIDSMSEKEIVQNWVQRIRDYYISPAKEMDKVQNGFASLILQMCAIDALASFVSNEKTVEQKIRNFCHIMINNSQNYQVEMMKNKGVEVTPDLSEREIEKATQHLYYQYRCGLVHNGFTLQTGEFARKNEPDHIFLISYESSRPVTTTHVGKDKIAFLVNPTRFLTMIQFELSSLQASPADKINEIANKVLVSLKNEIEIAKLL